MSVSNNGYFRFDDVTVKALGGKALPGEWWSRPYEYAWALRFVDKKHTVADMGCGWMGRPFTPELARQCKEVYAIDADNRVTGLENEHGNLFYIPMDFSNSEMDYFKTSTFDAIFCLSVIEDLRADDRLAALKNFRRLVKPKGKIVITMDAIWEPWRIAEPYPTVNLMSFNRNVAQAGLRFVGEPHLSMPKNAVHHARWNLSCYHCVLERDK
jgi:2-polyprenyl-3-methyl-5-hydroxy-6-metoxy-1,4-benzoquinol methylase